MRSFFLLLLQVCKIPKSFFFKIEKHYTRHIIEYLYILYLYLSVYSSQRRGLTNFSLFSRPRCLKNCAMLRSSKVVETIDATLEPAKLEQSSKNN